MVQLRLTDIGRTYAGTSPVEALRDVSLTIPTGDFVAFVGPSGSGKSTLLNVVAMLDRPSRGTYAVGGRDVAGLSERHRAALRSATFGFVFQSFHLLDRWTAVENVELGVLYRGLSRRARRVEAMAALDQVGMVQRAHHRANTLSGGESQRVAIARALVGGVPVLVADEPTGNLDSANGQAIADLFLGLHRSGKTIVLVTHDANIAGVADRQLALRDGRLEDDDLATPAPSRAQNVVADVPEDDGASVVALAAAGADGPTSSGGRSHTSRVRVRDLLGHAWRAATARRGRATALVGAVAVASTLVVATLGLSGTASAQVSDEFNLRRNREVAVDAPDALGGGGDGLGAGQQAVMPPDAERRVRALAGVGSAGLVTNLDQQPVSSSPTRPPHQIGVMSISDGLLDTVAADVRWLPGHDTHLGGREVVVGTGPAQQLELSSLLNGPALVVNGVSFAVAGVVDDVQRHPELLSAVLMNQEGAEEIGGTGPTSLLIQTDSGAAPQVARQVAVALDPVDPDRFDVRAPPDPTSLRAAIESDVSTAMFVLSTVAFVAAVVGIGNAMTMGVIERTGELGLRRALGARPLHVLSQVAIESSAIGALGGLVGLYVGMSGVLGVTLVRHWRPVLDMRLVPLAIASGALAGVLGGLAAGLRASRVQPTDALRQ